jgi:hypothetical protein
VLVVDSEKLLVLGLAVWFGRILWQITGILQCPFFTLGCHKQRQTLYWKRFESLLRFKHPMGSACPANTVMKFRHSIDFVAHQSKIGLWSAPIPCLLGMGIIN